jgi:adenylyltransferase/sulfurtransferase
MPSVRILLPSPLRRFAGGERAVAVSGQTLLDAVTDLARQHPDLAPHLLGEDGRPQPFLRLYVGDEDAAALQGPETPLAAGAEVSIVPAIAGGAPSAGTASPAETPEARAAALADRFSKAELERYSRHLILPEFGIEGQARLKDARVLVVGSGGLGAPLLQYLAAAGVGTLGILDFDRVEDHNLQRQVLFSTADVGRPKVEAAAERIRGLNPHITVRTHDVALTADNALEIIADYDLVADGTDNFPTRYLVNDACVLLGKPNVYASIYRFDGQVSVFNRLRPDGRRGPNYRDLFPAPPPPGLVPSCAEGGVLGVLPGILGSLQAGEVIKVLSGTGEPLDGRLLLIDAATMETRTLKLHPNPDNPLTGERPTQTGLVDYAQFCGLPAPGAPAAASGEDARPAAPARPDPDAVPGLGPAELAERLAGPEPPLVIDVREPHEYAIANLGAPLLPVGQVEARRDEIPRDRPVVLHCRSGVRSANALRLLRDRHGYTNLLNLEGGILAWARDIDPDMATY